MDAIMKQLIQIKNYIELACMCSENGLARLYYMNADILLQKLSVDLNNCMLELENEASITNQNIHQTMPNSAVVVIFRTYPQLNGRTTSISSIIN
ncbi:unnamed protein product [Rotaria sordida]|uniref:Uncharacterized protein n=1 Tax=Rotaria sordida TaxID=392033 RepID=A0A813RBD9_9BILA|nr:unnamed protein product [Rotaria sordida]CAF0880261.1 unnamed protein product [Rotaria sordida]CAF4013162.1 unnamed protein product [Rotaria sordida]